MRLKLSIARFEVSLPDLKIAVEGFAQNRIRAIDGIVEDGRRLIADFLNRAMLTGQAKMGAGFQATGK